MRLLALFCVTFMVVGCGKTAADDKTPKSSITSGQDASEPQAKGKPIGTWAQQLRDKDVSKRIEAAQVLKGVGPQAKAAIPDLKLALKERAWELLIEYIGKSPNGSFTPVSGKLGGGAPQSPTKDEIIADLRRDLELKKKELAEAYKRVDDLGNDPCLAALMLALDAIDRREMVEMIPNATVVGPTKTFKAGNAGNGPAPK
jgi:hypothetical protein